MIDGARGFAHVYAPSSQAVVPIGMQVDDVLYLADVHHVGEDADPSDDVVAQMAAALQAMTAVVERSGYSLDNVARCTGYVTQLEHREPIYAPWDGLFPAPDDRPAFKVLLADLPPGHLVRLDALAVANGRRTRIDIAGVPARDPTVACGRFLFTSRVHGTDPATARVKAGGVDAEIAQCFDNVLALAALAGAAVRDISQITAFLRDIAFAPAVAERFAATFGADGPHLNVMPAFIPDHLNVMLEMSAERSDVP